MKMKLVKFSELKGKTLSSVKRKDNEECIEFITTDGTKYVMYHEQDCCEGVFIKDIVGDLDDLVGAVIEVADERTNYGEDKYEHETWTFYTLRTIKGTVDITWYGSSNGYYSEEAGLYEVID